MLGTLAYVTLYGLQIREKTHMCQLLYVVSQVSAHGHLIITLYNIIHTCGHLLRIELACVDVDIISASRAPPELSLGLGEGGGGTTTRTCKSS